MAQENAFGQDLQIVSLITNHLQISNRQSISGESLNATKLRVVSMILVYCHIREINDRAFRNQSLPDHPMVPVAVSHDQRRHIFVQSSVEQKEINPKVVLLFSATHYQFPQIAFPVSAPKIKRLGDVRVPTTPYGKKRRVSFSSFFVGPPKIGQQNDVAVGETEIRVTSNRLGTTKYVVQVLRAGFMPLDVWLVSQPVFLADLGCAFLIAKQNHFDVRVKKFPGLETVALNDIIVVVKIVNIVVLSPIGCALKAFARRSSRVHRHTDVGSVDDRLARNQEPLALRTSPSDCPRPSSKNIPSAPKKCPIALEVVPTHRRDSKVPK